MAFNENTMYAGNIDISTEPPAMYYQVSTYIPRDTPYLPHLASFSNIYRKYFINSPRSLPSTEIPPLAPSSGLAQ